MESEDSDFLRRILDEVGDRRDVAAREEDGDIVFPSIRVAKDPILGCFLTEGLMQAFRDMVHRKYRKCERLDKIPIVFKPAKSNAVNQKATEQLMDLIEDAKRFHSSNLIYSNALGLEIYLPRRLDFRMDLCEIFKIPDTDRRVKLRGQKGVRATRFIEMDTVLGVYRGLILPRYVTDHNLVRNPRKNWERTVQEWECELRRYMMETDLHIVNPATGRQETVPLDISPYGYNSPGGLINDPRITTEHPVHMDPYLNGEKLRFSTDDLDPPQTVAPENTTVQSAYVFGFPFAVVITIRPLIAGEELLFNYGPDHFLLPGHFPQPNALM